jgi:hypothetical protein
MINIEPQPQDIPVQEVSIKKGLKTEITTEQQEILESAVKFAKFLTSRWPQVERGRMQIIEIDNGGTTVELPELPEAVEIEQTINYYLSGSLVPMLLSCADSFSEIDETQIPALVESGTREIPKSARKIFASFARQIGDLDYVPADHYKYNPSRLKKGGGGPSFDEVPEDGLKVLKRRENQTKVMCDPVETYGAGRIAKVNIEGQDYYVARPDTIFAYKVLHLLQNYEENPGKFNSDFGKLFFAMKEIYSEDELLQITTQILSDYDNDMEASHQRFHKGDEAKPYERKILLYTNRVLENQNITSEIRTVIEKIQKKFVTSV